MESSHFSIFGWLRQYRVFVALGLGALVLAGTGAWWYFYVYTPLPTDCGPKEKRRPIVSLLQKKYTNASQVAPSFRRIHQCLQQSEDPRVGFLRMYIIVTDSILQWTSTTECTYPKLTRRLVVKFANQYREAFKDYIEGSLPKNSWALYFRYMRTYKDKKFRPLVAMLLGMNSHINEDLSFAFEVLGPELPRARGDYFLINRVFRRILGTLRKGAKELEEAAGHKWPKILDVDDVGLFFIRSFRKSAWEWGQRYTHAKGVKKSQVKKEIIRLARSYSHILVAAGSSTLGLQQLITSKAPQRSP